MQQPIQLCDLSEFENFCPTGLGIHEFADDLSDVLNVYKSTQVTRPDHAGVFVNNVDGNIDLKPKKAVPGTPEFEQLEFLVSTKLQPFVDALEMLNASGLSFTEPDRFILSQSLSLTRACSSLLSKTTELTTSYPFFAVQSPLSVLYTCGENRVLDINKFDPNQFDLLIFSDLYNINARFLAPTSEYPTRINYNCTSRNIRGETQTVGVVVLKSPSNIYISLTTIKNGQTKMYSFGSDSV